MSSLNIRRLDVYIRIECECSLGIMFGAKVVRLALHLTKTSAPKAPSPWFQMIIKAGSFTASLFFTLN